MVVLIVCFLLGRRVFVLVGDLVPCGLAICARARAGVQPQERQKAAKATFLHLAGASQTCGVRPQSCSHDTIALLECRRPSYHT